MILLNNGLEIPEIGFGTFPQKETLPESVEYAYSAGFRMFDTSDNYRNENYLGQAVSNNANNRKGSIIISKFSQAARTKELETCFRESREKLDGSLDIYLLHWPYPYLWKEQWRRMERLYEDGKCRGIGVCNFEVDKLRELLSFCRTKPVINQIERHPLFQQNEIVRFCKDNDIRVMCYSPTARHDPELFESDILKNLAEKYHKTVGQVVLRWDIDTGTVPIPASKSEAHIKENADVFDFVLSDEDIDRINSLERGKRIRYAPNKRFNLRQKMRFMLVRAQLRGSDKKN